MGMDDIFELMECPEDKKERNNEEYMKEVNQKKRSAPVEKIGETSNKKRETPKARGKEPEQDRPEKCQRCGGRHSDDQCRWNTRACFGCGKQGHLVKIAQKEWDKHESIS
ncbi:hypothetical protein F0562_028061 [Nyssa sinensis]|uniref:CCHC-type domain-containing protein n=1 Tax=Nyssa sinensis TaxID=561372 RepID=A0A5J5B5A5_9ASTE|nr:hypothetical protein F0562_028061 [Nyssa sinensis]